MSRTLYHLTDGEEVVVTRPLSITQAAFENRVAEDHTDGTWRWEPVAVVDYNPLWVRLVGEIVSRWVLEGFLSLDQSHREARTVNQEEGWNLGDLPDEEGRYSRWEGIRLSNEEMDAALEHARKEIRLSWEPG